MLQCTYSHDTYMSIYYVDVNSSSSQATKYQFLKLRNICLISSAIPTPWRGALPPAWRPGGAFIGRSNMILSTCFFHRQASHNFVNMSFSLWRSLFIVARSATWDGGGELELLQKHLQKQAAAAVKRCLRSCLFTSDTGT